MGKKINNNELKAIGFHDEKQLKIAGLLAKNLIKDRKYSKEAILDVFREIIDHPEKYFENEIFRSIATFFHEQNVSDRISKQNVREYSLLEKPIGFQIFGRDYIEKQAIEQMSMVMRLPIVSGGALMPDAHQGYGLPIGGVLVTKREVVIPYAVGVDIACRMCLSIFEMDGNYLEQKKTLLKTHLIENTYFGLDAVNHDQLPDDIFDHQNWSATNVIKKLRHKAERQLGTSGTGNHFVEWGLLEIEKEDEALQLPKGKYLALLSHSGSRGFGAGIANYYSKLAMEKTRLPYHFRHLAWLDMNSEEGLEYWVGMNLAGDFASACHYQIHRRLAKELGIKPLKTVENHHNFAWLETFSDGKAQMVHRKGATPAGKDVLGIIPGSMAQPGYVVKGKGDESSFNSASHGAGRLMSRSKALNSITKPEMKKVLSEKGVILTGGDIDEAPMAYKDLKKVMAAQEEFVAIIAKFSPKIVRMANPDKHPGGAWEK